MSRKYGPFVPDGGYEEEEHEPDILEQVDRIRRGLPPREPKGILAQVDRILKGLPPRESNDILAQAERKIREAQGGWTPPWRRGRSQDRNDPREIHLGALEYGEDAGLWGQSWVDDASWPWPIPDDKETTTVNLLPPRRAPESLLVRRARERHWRLEGATATAGPAATLSGLAEAITGHAEDWKLLDFPREPWKLRVGDKVNVMPLLEKAAGKHVQAPKVDQPPPVTGVSSGFIDKLRDFITQWEGRRNGVYRDTKGFWTVGIGFNLSVRKREFQRLLPNVSYNDLVAGKIQLTDEQVNLLFEFDVAEDIRKAMAAVPDFNTLPEEVRLVLVDMCHQFGSPWPRLNAAIRRKDYREVSKEIWSDDWVRDTRMRALHHIRVVREWARQQQGHTGP